MSSNEKIAPIGTSASSKNKENESSETTVDALGLLAETGGRNRNESDEDVDPDEYDHHSPNSVRDNQEEREVAEEGENYQPCEDESNVDQDQFEENDDEIDISEDFVLQYDSSEERNKGNNESSVLKNPHLSNIDLNNSQLENVIVSVVSLASLKESDPNADLVSSAVPSSDDVSIDNKGKIGSKLNSNEANINTEKNVTDKNAVELNSIAPLDTNILTTNLVNNEDLANIDIEDFNKECDSALKALLLLKTTKNTGKSDVSDKYSHNDKNSNEKDLLQKLPETSAKPINSNINDNKTNKPTDGNSKVCPKTFSDIEILDSSDEEKNNTAKPITANKDKSKNQEKPESPNSLISKPDETPNTQTLEPTKKSGCLDIVDLDDSSDEETKHQPNENSQYTDMATISVCIPSSIEIKSSNNSASNISHRDSGASIISGLPASQPKASSKMRINMAEITISTICRNAASNDEIKPVEILNLDSDDEDIGKKTDQPDDIAKNENSGETPIEQESPNDKHVSGNDNEISQECVNPLCEKIADAKTVPSPLFVLEMLKIKRMKRPNHPNICEHCLNKVLADTNLLIAKFYFGIPILNTELPSCDDPVEVVDSDSENEDEEIKELIPYSVGSPLPEDELNFFSENLVDTLESICHEYNFVGQIEKCSNAILNGVKELENRTEETVKEIDELIKNTARIKKELYDGIKIKTTFLPPIDIPNEFECDEAKSAVSSVQYTSLAIAPSSQVDDSIKKNPKNVRTKFTPNRPTLQEKENDICDRISEIDPEKSLPPIGAFVQPSPAVGDCVYTVKQSIFGAWIPATIININPIGTPMANGMPLLFSLLTVKYMASNRFINKQVTGRQVAFSEPAKVRYPIGTRVIALFKDVVTIVKKDAYYSGVIAEPPSPINKFRYLVFFDDGYSQYVHHDGILPVAERSTRVWEDVHPDSRDFVRKYLLNYPERPMVRMQRDQIVRTEKNGSWWDAKVIALDASLALLRFEGAGTRDEWIYRGSTRLSLLYQQLQAAGKRAAGRHRPTNHPSLKTANSPYVEYTRTQDDVTIINDGNTETEKPAKPQRAVAKKSTASAADQKLEDLTPEVMDSSINQVKSRVVYYSPKMWIHPDKMVRHMCNEKCLSKPGIQPLANLRTYNPLTKPLLSGWERQIVKFRYKRLVMYKAPCGRRLRNMEELHRYLRLTKSKMSVDLFDFNHKVHCLAEFILVKCFVTNLDISHGAEEVPVPCVNYYDHSLPEFWIYKTRRYATEGVDLNLDEEFLCGCDCTDDCQDKEKCRCWQLTYEGVRYMGLDTKNVGYQYKRLLDQVPTGIYECNSRCKCQATCLNRVVQHPLQLKLQVFKTYNRGWGIRALNDIPKGSFICTYAGNLLTDAVANADGGTHEGDKYLADLDYIEVVERLKESYEADVPDEDKILDNANKAKPDSPTSEDEGEDDDDYDVNNDSETSKKAGRGESDDEFNPGIITSKQTNKRSLRPRRKQSGDGPDDLNSQSKKRKLGQIKIEKDVESNDNKEKPTDTATNPSTSGTPTESVNSSKGNDMITISDDDEIIREPSRFAAPEGFDDDEYVPRHRSVRALYGSDESCYIMDARVQGNIGRYLNHSCSPNMFVQNVFVDTQDPRFPWVAFFALVHIRAGTELTWNYSYDIGSVPGKVIYCRCGASNCRGRLL